MGHDLRFVVDGPPVPCERPRVVARGGHAVAFTPGRTRRYQRQVALVARAALPPGWPLDAVYSLGVTVYWPDRRRRDLSNILKSIEDGCNRIVWDDDCQVTSIYVRGALDRERPRVEVRIATLHPEAP
jgi:Holliday junction resolvase RusA-like endonuclease